MEGPLLIIKMAELVLEHIKRPLSTTEMWEEGKKLGLADRVKHTGKTPWASLGAQIYVDIRDNPDTIFFQYSKRPARFFLKKYQNEVPLIDTPQNETQEIERKFGFLERDLHPLLCRFVYSNQHFKCRVKTIYHEGSQKAKKGFNEWLYPDLVGVYFPFDDYDDVTLRAQKSFSLNQIKLFSFEMKRDLHFGNLRNSYFQAVSNSSWAHEGYLVVLKIEKDDSFLQEIQRLNNAHGIGLIALNPESIDESEILFPSRIQSELDWDTINRLVENNKDFRIFIEDVIEDIQIGKIKGSYDPKKSIEELTSFMKENHIS